MSRNRELPFDSRYPDKYKFLEEKKLKSIHTKQCSQECPKHNDLVNSIKKIVASEFNKSRLNLRIENTIFECGNTFGYCGRPEFVEARGKETKATLCESLFDFV